jgi:hypothetical protein
MSARGEDSDSQVVMGMNRDIACFTDFISPAEELTWVPLIPVHFGKLSLSPSVGMTRNPGAL